MVLLEYNVAVGFVSNQVIYALSVSFLSNKLFIFIWLSICVRLVSSYARPVDPLTLRKTTHTVSESVEPSLISLPLEPQISFSVEGLLFLI